MRGGGGILVRYKELFFKISETAKVNYFKALTDL
jgi:hypothetical protein